jgi:phage gp46-like protein
MTDVLLRQTDDGGEISYVNGAAIMSDGLESAVYLSLFGGNIDDGGLTEDDARSWWGNAIEPLEERRYRSQTQGVLRSMPAIPANLQRVDDAVGADLAWMLDTKLATFVGSASTMPAINTVKISIRVEIDGKIFPFEFTEPWRNK